MSTSHWRFVGNTSACPPTHTRSPWLMGNHPGSDFQACGMGKWVCGSVETYGFCYLHPSLTWLKYNSDITSLLSTSAGLVLQFFSLMTEGHDLLSVMGRRKKMAQSKSFPLTIPHPYHGTLFCSGPPLFSHKRLQPLPLSPEICHNFHCLSDPTTLFTLCHSYHVEFRRGNHSSCYLATTFS